MLEYFISFIYSYSCHSSLPRHYFLATNSCIYSECCKLERRCSRHACNLQSTGNCSGPWAQTHTNGLQWSGVEWSPLLQKVLISSARANYQCQLWVHQWQQQHREQKTCSSNSSGSSNFSGKMSTSTAPQMFKDAYVRRAKLK